MGSKQERKKKDFWTSEETFRFLLLWKYNSERIGGIGPKKELYQKLSAELAEEGITKTGEQLHKKIENMKMLFNKYKQESNGGSHRWQYFDQIRQILEGNPNQALKQIVKKREQLKSGVIPAQVMVIRDNQQTCSSTATKKDVLNELRQQNKQLLEDLSFERDLNKILENIRNNSLILIQNCECLTNHKTRNAIKHLNTIYTDLKTKQNISELNRNKTIVNVNQIETNVVNEDNFVNNSPQNQISEEVFRISGLKTSINKRLEDNEVLTPEKGMKTIGFKADLNSKYSLITEMFKLKNQSHKSDDNSDTEHIVADNDINEFEAIDCKPILTQTVDNELQTITSPSLETSNELSGHSSAQYTHLFECKIKGCLKSFTDKRDLYEHKKVKHLKDSLFECEFCDYCTDRSHDLNRHLYSHSSAKLSKSTTDGSNKKFKTVPQSDDNSDIEEVIRSNHNSKQSFETIYFKPNISSLSDPELQSTPRPSIHESVDTSEESKNEDIPQVFNCSVCIEKFDQKLKLQNHLSKNHRIKSFECESCDYKTFSIYHLKRHKTSHTSEKPFICTIDGCDTRFKTKEHLYEHKILKHSNETRFQCELCDYKTNRRATFNYHKNLHSRQDPKDRPFKCSISGCNKAYKLKLFLEAHNKRSHHKTNQK